MIVNHVEVAHALNSASIVPVFQPLAALRTGEWVGFEVLARWKHPLHGLILPLNFIAQVEEQGLIEQLSEQVFRQAFLSGVGLPEPLFLAVNVSPAQLRDDRLPQQLSRWAQESGFPLERVIVEITETALLENLEQAQRVVRQLKEHGCRLALDDFGTGYSSLAHLQSLPFDKLKIDRSFIMTMLKRRESRKIVAAVMGLGDSLGVETVAEGVETEEQAEMLLSMGCKFAQGWFYGRPMPAGALAEALAAPPRTLADRLANTNGARTTLSLEAHPAERLSQLQAIYHGAPVGLCYLDRNLRYVSINRKLAEMNRVPVADHIGRTVQDIHPDAFAVFEPFLRRALAGESVSGVEIVRPPSATGGDPEINLASYEPALDEAGEIVGLSISVIDITALKRAEEALRESDDLYRHLFDNLRHVPWIMDNKGNPLAILPRWSGSRGWSDLLVPGRNWMETIHPEDSERVMAELQVALRGGTPINVEYRDGSPETGWVWKRSTGSPHVGPKGEITRWYGSVEDVDRTKQLESDLRTNRDLVHTLTSAAQNLRDSFRRA